jgi:hypothetical protein
MRYFNQKASREARVEAKAYVNAEKRHIPGIYPRQVSAMLMRKSHPQPFSSNTPRGGRMTAKINLKMSEQVRAIVILLSE